jgi:hypothetical protein
MQFVKLNKLHIFIVLIFVIVLGFSLLDVYKNHLGRQKDLMENYNQINAEITFVGRTGNREKTRALLQVVYNYNGSDFSGSVTRAYRGENYYKIGDYIAIRLNPNNPEDIQ